MKKLYKSEQDSLVWGILGGIGEYFDIDPTVLRLGYVVLVLITGIFPGIIAYIVAYFIIPERPIISHESTVNSQQKNQKTNDHTVTETPTKTDLELLNIKMEEKDKFAQGERQAPEVAEELAIPENIGELKKPNWPKIDSRQSIVNSQQEVVNYPENESQTATLDSLMEDDRDVSIDDITDAE